MVRAERSGTRLMIFLSEDDRVGRRVASEVLLQRAREDGMAGATLWRGVEGFGRAGKVRSTRFVDAAQGAPLVLELIDETGRIDEFLGVVAELAPWALVTREPVDIVRHRDSTPSALDDPRPATGVSVQA
jgi:hypothetical protein